MECNIIVMNINCGLINHHQFAAVYLNSKITDMLLVKILLRIVVLVLLPKTITQRSTE